MKQTSPAKVTDLHILYLHGFLSSPQSKKAQQTLRYCQSLGIADRLLIPSMLDGPAETIEQLEDLIDGIPLHQLGVIGSSLGGYYATWIAEEFGVPAVLINPAVRPFELWEDHLGEHKNYYSDHIHVVTRDHIAELKSLDRHPLKYPEQFMVMLQTGDEVLDYRDAEEKFQDSRLLIHENGDHSYQQYDAELPVVIEFLLSRIDRSAR